MSVSGIDHIALPTANGERFLAFYKAIGFTSPDETDWREGRSPIFSIAISITVPTGFVPGARLPQPGRCLAFRLHRGSLCCGVR